MFSSKGGYHGWAINVMYSGFYGRIGSKWIGSKCSVHGVLRGGL